MFFSYDQKMLFIAAPKTGSTSVEETLSSCFPDGEKFKIYLNNDVVITSSHVKSPSLGHAKAREFRDVLGNNLYDDIFVFGFVRDPIEKIVSAYFFIRSGRLSDAFMIKSEKKRTFMIIKRIISILSARVLPLGIWALIYPVKNCYSYFTDESGRIMVDCLGATQRLSSDLHEIMKLTGRDLPADSVSHVNKSRHRAPEDYWLLRVFIPLLKMRYRRDIELAQLVKNGVWWNCSALILENSDHAK